MHLLESRSSTFSGSTPSDLPSCKVRPLVATPTLPNAMSTMKCFETTASLLLS